MVIYNHTDAICCRGGLPVYVDGLLHVLPPDFSLPPLLSSEEPLLGVQLVESSQLPWRTLWRSVKCFNVLYLYIIPNSLQMIQLPKFHLKYKVKTFSYISEISYEISYGGFIIFVFKVINYSLLYMPTQLHEPQELISNKFFTYRVTDRCIFKENKFLGRIKFPFQFKILW